MAAPFKIGTALQRHNGCCSCSARASARARARARTCGRSSAGGGEQACSAQQHLSDHFVCRCTRLPTCEQPAVLAQGESELSKSQKKKQKKKAAARKKACEDADVGTTSTGAQSRSWMDEAAQSYEHCFDRAGSGAGEKGAPPTGESNGCANGHATGNGHAAGGPAVNGTAGKKQGKGKLGALPQQPSCCATGRLLFDDRKRTRTQGRRHCSKPAPRRCQYQSSSPAACIQRAKGSHTQKSARPRPAREAAWAGATPQRALKGRALVVQPALAGNAGGAARA